MKTQAGFNNRRRLVCGVRLRPERPRRLAHNTLERMKSRFSRVALDAVRGRIVLNGPSKNLAHDPFVREAYLGVTPVAAGSLL